MELQSIISLCRAEAEGWSGVKAVMYVDGSIHDSVVTPRDKVVPGVNLLAGGDNCGGWTSFSAVIVESVNGNAIETSRGTIITDSGIYYTKSNVMPYADGAVEITLVVDKMRLTVPAMEGFEEQTIYVPSNVWRSASRHEPFAARQMLIIIEEQLPEGHPLIAIQRKYVETICKDIKWAEFRCSVEVAGQDFLPRYRVEAIYSKSTLEDICIEAERHSEQRVYLYEPNHTMIWRMFAIADDGTETPYEPSFDVRHKMMISLPGVEFNYPQSGYLSIMASTPFESPEMNKSGYVALNTDVPYTYEIAVWGFKYKFRFEVTFLSSDR